MRRVTVKQFIRAVRQTGVIPARCLWVKEEKGKVRACGIGTMAVAAEHKNDARRYAQAADGLGLHADYISGYISGFDGNCKPRKKSAEAEAGFEDGRACALAVFEQRLHEDERYSVEEDVDLTPYLETPWDGGDESESYVYTGAWS